MPRRSWSQSPQIDWLENRALLSTVDPSLRATLPTPAVVVARLDSSHRSAQVSGTLAPGGHDVIRMGSQGVEPARIRITSEPLGSRSTQLSLAVRGPDGVVLGRRTRFSPGQSLDVPAQPGFAYTLDISRPGHLAGTYKLQIEQRPVAPVGSARSVVSAVALPVASGIPTATVAPFQSRLVRGVISVQGPVGFRLVPTASGSLILQNLTATETLTVTIQPSDLLQTSVTLTIDPGSLTALSVTAGTSYRVRLAVATSTLVPFLITATLVTAPAAGSNVEII
jgi:hypothetical protein